MRAALITGSSKGLGRSLALEFARNKYNVILHGRDKERLLAIEKEILKHDVLCDVVIGDITSKETMLDLFYTAEKRNLNILVNNAAVYEKGSFLKMVDEEIEWLMEVNLFAPITLIKDILPILKKKREGLIININSIAGKKSDLYEAIYCASKHGLRGFSNSIRLMAAKDKVRILDVYLGAMKTDMVRDRPDFDKFIDPGEAASVIFALSQGFDSLTVREVEIGRRNY